MCHFWEVHCKIGETVSKAADDIISKWAENVMDGINRTLTTLGSIWGNVPANVGSDQGSIQFLKTNTSWLVVLLAGGSIAVAAMQLAWSQRGEPARRILAGMLRLAVVGAAFPAITQMLISIGDGYSTWIIQQASDADDGKFLTKVLDVSQFTSGGLGLMVIILGGLIALLTNVIQVFLMFTRSGLLTVLTGLSPLAAAASMTAWGEAWLNKYIAWTMAFVAFKPTAATIYATALKLLSGDGYSFTDESSKFFMGIILLILAVVALPALVAFLVPVTAGLGQGGGGGAPLAALGGGWPPGR